jgi:hypothetical protein
MHPYLDDATIEKVATAVREAVGQTPPVDGG